MQPFGMSERQSASRIRRAASQSPSAATRNAHAVPNSRRGQFEQETGVPARTPIAASWDFSTVPVLPPSQPAGRWRAFSPVAPSVSDIRQFRLAVGRVDDPLEHEADSAADQVMRMPGAAAATIDASPRLGRKSVLSGQIGPPAPDTRRPGQPKAVANETSATVHEVLRAPGQPLDAATRAFMEPRFGYNFSRVRVHTDATAAETARSVGAVAYTVGSDVVFGPGQYSPGQDAGRRLLAHELAHTIHQGASLRGVPRKAAGRSGYDRESDAVDGASPPTTPLQPLTRMSSSMIMRQSAHTDEMPMTDRDDTILLQHGLPTDPRSPEQRKLDEFRDRMKASYRTPGGATATVAPPFGMGAGYESQQASAADPKRIRHLENAKRKNPRISQFIVRVQFARGSPEEISAVTQALIDDKALDDEGSAASLEQNIQHMMFNYRIGTDCAGYVQQAYLSAKGIGRTAAGFKGITNERLDDLERRGFTQVAPSAASPGDLVVMDPPPYERVGHRAIVYSCREATADDKEELKKKKFVTPGTDYSSFWPTGTTIYVLELDSSWGSGGNPEFGGIQRRTFWYNPAGSHGSKWAWVQDDPNWVFAGENPYGHPLHGTGFYRGPSRASSNP